MPPRKTPTPAAESRGRIGDHLDQLGEIGRKHIPQRQSLQAPSRARKASGLAEMPQREARREDDSLGKRVAVAAKATSAQARMQTVCIGRTVCGHVLRRPRLGFEAFDADDNSLGIFATPAEAANVIVDALERKTGSAP